MGEEEKLLDKILPQEEVEATKAPPPKRPYLIPRILVWGIFWLGFAYVISFFVQVVGDMPSLADIENPASVRSSQIYTEDNVLLGRIHHGENRIVLELDEISPHVLNALIATEDKRYYEHSGIDPLSIPSIISRYLASERITGASTITMQLARNLFGEIGRERTIRRKLNEILVAILLEKNFTKTEILSHYLNTVNIYSNCYGIETAALRLYGKHAIDLNLSESAMIVGLLKGQGKYSPHRNPTEAINRRNVVLGLMLQQGMVAPPTFDSLQYQPIVLESERKTEEEESTLAPYFRERVRLWAETWGEGNGYDVYEDGLQIYTTIDSRIQRHAERSVEGYMKRLQKTFDRHIRGHEPWKKDKNMLKRLMRQSYRYMLAKKKGKTDEQIEEEFNTRIPMTVFDWEGEVDTMMSPMDSIRHYSRFLEAGLAAIDPKNGHVKAWAGGINYKHFKYDHVEFSKRQTGSTFKPFVYAAAIDNGMKPCQRELNQHVHFDLPNGQRWMPDNAGDDVGGYVTLKKALEYSLNVVTARLTKRIGIQTVVDYAHRLGIQTEIAPHPAACLGTTELSVLEMTGAYATFANQGVWNEPVFVSHIKDRNGKIIYQAPKVSRSAISEEVAYVMVDMLKSVVRDNYGTGAGIKDQYGIPVQVGGKTGTTQNHSDGWFIGMTPNLVAGVWVGCAERKMRFNNLRYGQGAYMAKPIFGSFLGRVYGDRNLTFPDKNFYKPPGIDVYMDCEMEKVFTSNPDPYRRGRNAATGEEELPKGFKGWD